MIIALLILIIFILLFGAAAVKGWIFNAATILVGFVILVGLVIWVGSFFGDDGPMYVIIGGGTLLTILAFWVQRPPATKQSGVEAKSADPKVRFHSRAPSREERKRLRGR